MRDFLKVESETPTYRASVSCSLTKSIIFTAYKFNSEDTRIYRCQPDLPGAINTFSTPDLVNGL